MSFPSTSPSSTSTSSISAVPATIPLAIRVAAIVHLVVAEFVDSLATAATRLTRRLRDDRGQATTEYALVLLAAALVALLVVAWATAGGGAAKISRLFNRVIDAVIDRV